MSVNLLTIDIETTMNADGVYLSASHPMHPSNKIVMLGFIPLDDYTRHVVTTIKEDDFQIWPSPDSEMFPVDFLVGHNIGFDLKYLYRNPKAKEKLQKYRLWDTQLAAYLLSGQTLRWASLDDLCDKYGLPKKDSKVTDYFKRGKGADKVPMPLLEEYLKSDVENTDKIARRQIEEAVDRNMLPLIISQMEALHATIEMGFNGLAIDFRFLDSFTETIKDKATKAKLIAETIADGIDVASNKQLSTWFFGGTKKIVTKTAVGVYKNGKVKYKNIETEEIIPKQITAKEEWKNKTGVSVDDEVLKYIKTEASYHASNVAAVATAVLDYREYSKIEQTYCGGIRNNFISGFVHGDINHCATVTGRLSSNNPNLQNIANSEVKRSFISRFGDDGSLVEFDFNQLEIVALAHLSKDERLIHDISTGSDIHRELYRDMYGKYPTAEERKPFKSRTFQLLYGAGAKAIAKSAGIPEKEGYDFIETFYTRYPQVKVWQEDMLRSADSFGKLEIGTGGKRSFVWTSETKRQYVFKEYENQDWKKKASGRLYSFSPTELKNYPVQGLATADIVPLMLGVLFRKLQNIPEYEGTVLLVNTIHDSVLFDVHKDHLLSFYHMVKNILNNTNSYFEGTFGHKLSLKLNVGCSEGKNWFDMTEVTL